MIILITGGAGFIGSSLAHRLASDPNNSIVIVDNLLTGHASYVPSAPNVCFCEGSVNDSRFMRQLFMDYRFDIVFHYAAVVGVQRTLTNPLSVLSDVSGFENVFQLSALTGVSRVVYASSSEVYGEPVEVPQTEDHTPLNSRLPYAVVKNLGEMYCKSYFAEHNLPFTVLRFFNTYGPRQSSDFVISRFLKAALNGEPITIYGDGQQSRTFCYISDNIDATISIIANSTTDECHVINIGNHKQYTILELAQAVLSVTNSSSKIEYLPPLKEGDMLRRQPCIDRMCAYLDRPLISLETGLRSMLADPHFSKHSLKD